MASAAQLFIQCIKSATASPQIHSTDPDYFTFTTTKKQTWLLTLDDASHPLARELLSHEEHWTIATYDKKILQVVGTALAEGKAVVNMLYDMKLGEGKGLNPQLDEELRVAGIDITDGREWFVQKFPDKANVVHTHQVWVARSRSQADSEPIGHIITLTRSSDVYIFGIEVEPAHQSKGLGRKLMQFAHAKGRDRTIWLNVFAENPPAVGLYHSLGYRIEKVLWLIAKADKAQVATEGAGAVVQDVPLASSHQVETPS